MSVDTEVMWLTEERVVSLAELVEVSGLTEAELLELAHSGVLPPREFSGGVRTFSASVVTTARMARRLRHDFELDTPGLVLALRLLERLEELEAEVARLRAQLPGRMAGR